VFHPPQSITESKDCATERIVHPFLGARLIQGGQQMFEPHPPTAPLAQMPFASTRDPGER